MNANAPTLSQPEQAAVDSLKTIFDANDIDYELDVDLFMTLEPVAPTPLWLTIRVFEDDEVRIEVLIETLELEHLGKVGRFLPALAEDFGRAAVNRSDDRLSATLDITLETIFDPSTVMDWLGAAVNELVAVMHEIALTGTTWTLEDEPRTEGFVELLEAERLDENGRPADGLALALAAFATLEEAELELWATTGWSLQAILYIQLERFTEALEAAWEGESRASALNDDRPDILVLAQSVRARALLAAGREEEAEELMDLVRANPEYDPATAEFELLGEACAIIEHSRGRSLPLIETQRGQLESLGPTAPAAVRAQRLENLGLAYLGARQFDEGLGSLRRAATLYMAARLPGDAARVGMELASILALTARGFEEATELYDRALPELLTNLTGTDKSVIESAAGALGRPLPWEDTVRTTNTTRTINETADINAISRAFMDGRFDTARSLLEAADTELAELDQPYGERAAANDHMSAALVMQETFGSGRYPTHEELDPAIERALRALRFIDDQRRQSDDRRRQPDTLDAVDALVDYYGRLYMNVFLLATFAGRYNLALEVIELVRSQGLDLASADPDRPGGEEAEGPVQSILEGSLGWTGGTTPPAVTIGNVSAIDFAARTKVDMEAVVRRQGGPEAWYWTQWKWGPILLWATMGPDGTTCSGFLAVGGDESRLKVFEWDLGDQIAEDARRFALYHQGMAGEMTPGDEAELAASLGQEMVPPPIRRALANATSERPITIVFSPNEPAAGFPTPLLLVDGRRLLHIAEFQIAVPLGAFLVNRPEGQPLPITRIIDPTCEMEVFADLRTEPETAASQVGEFWRTAHQQGSLVFAGHGLEETANGGGPGLQLGPEPTDTVSVADLLEHRRAGVPSKVVLAGCSTSNIRGPGSYDQWGLPAVMIGLGTTEIVATRTNLQADLTVRTIVDRVTRDLEAAVSMPASLRAAQIERLQAGLHPGAGLDPAGQWASWVAYRLVGGDRP